MHMRSSLVSATVPVATAVLLAWAGIPVLGDEGATPPQIDSMKVSSQSQVNIEVGSLESRLWSAIERGDVTEVQASIDAGVNVNVEKRVTSGGLSADRLREMDLRGLTPVVLAALEGRVEVARAIIDGGADVDAMTVREFDGDGVEFLGTALMAAGRAGHVSVAQLLIDSGADVMASWKNTNALITAADTGNLDIVTLLVAAGAYKPGTFNGFKALRTARAKGHAEIAELLQAGLDEYVNSDAPGEAIAEGMRTGLIESSIKGFDERGGPEDEDGAGQLRQDAERGDVDAQAKLGLAYFLGNGVQKSEAESERWFRKAAEQGSADAQFGLGSLYLRRDPEVRQYQVLAHMWLSIAIANGTSQSRSATLMRNLAESNMSSREIRRATRRARKCVESSYQSCKP